MPDLTEETKMERETIIRWDETAELAILWTASAVVRRDWASFGFPIEAYGGGWRSRVPKDRVTYRVLAKQVENV